MNWIQENFKTIVRISFIVPIITVALVSISHVTIWYELTNPVSWALYLSIGVEIAALSSLAALTAQMGNKVYWPFLVVTFIQLVGNIYFSYNHLVSNSESFIKWVELVGPMMEFIGVTRDDMVSHKRVLALLSGGFLPLISLLFLHLLVSFNEKQDKSPSDDPKSVGNIDQLPIPEPQIPNPEEAPRSDDAGIVDSDLIPTTGTEDSNDLPNVSDLPKQSKRLTYSGRE